MARDSAESADREEAKRSTRKLATLLGAVALLGGLVVVTVLIMTDRGGDDGPSSPPAASPTTSAPASAAVLQAAPEGVRWEDFNGVAIPYSDEYGPHKVDGYGPATGFDHSPEGALVAATHLVIRAKFAPDATWREVVERNVAAGTGRDNWSARRAKISIKPGVPADAQLVQFVGFRVLEYSDSSASFELAGRAADARPQVGVVTVRWVDGDWRLVLQPDGSDGPVYPVQELTDYLPWRGL